MNSVYFLQDSTTDACCRNIAKSIIKFGNSVFQALEKGLKSNIRTVSRDCLTAVAWLGYELALMDSSNLRYFASETLLGGILCFLHPGQELDERLLECLSLYSYASGKGKRNTLQCHAGGDYLICELEYWWLEQTIKHKSRIRIIMIIILA